VAGCGAVGGWFVVGHGSGGAVGGLSWFVIIY